MTRDLSDLDSNSHFCLKSSCYAIRENTMAQSPEKSQAFLRQWLLYLQPSSLYNLNVKFPMLPLQSHHGKAPHLHASQLSSSEIFYKITSASLETGINLRNLPPAHSRGAVTFSVLRHGLSDSTHLQQNGGGGFKRPTSCHATNIPANLMSLYPF